MGGRGGRKEFPARRTKIPDSILQMGLFGSISITLGQEKGQMDIELDIQVAIFFFF